MAASTKAPANVLTTQKSYPSGPTTCRVRLVRGRSQGVGLQRPGDADEVLRHRAAGLRRPVVALLGVGVARTGSGPSVPVGPRLSGHGVADVPESSDDLGDH